MGQTILSVQGFSVQEGEEDAVAQDYKYGGGFVSVVGDGNKGRPSQPS